MASVLHLHSHRDLVWLSVGVLGPNSGRKTGSREGLKWLASANTDNCEARVIEICRGSTVANLAMALSVAKSAKLSAKQVSESQLFSLCFY